MTSWVRVGDFVVSSSLTAASAETLISYVFGSGEETVAITDMREAPTECGKTAYRKDVRVVTAAEFAECIKTPLNRELVETLKPRMMPTGAYAMYLEKRAKMPTPHT
jgi:hypothetical protein